MQNRRLYQEEGALFSWDCWAVHNLVSVWRRSACAFFTNVSTIAVIISRNHIFHVKGSLLHVQQFHIHHCLPQKSEPWSNNQLFIYIIYLKEQYIVIEVLPTLFVKIIFSKMALSKSIFSKRVDISDIGMYTRSICQKNKALVLECNRCFLINIPLSSRLSSSSLQVN